MEFSAVDDQKPHAVCIPFPAQGHINPMLKLAMLLHHKGFHITFVNTEFNHQRLLKSRGPKSLDGLPGFCFETIPDGLPPSDENATQDPLSLCLSTQKNCLLPLRRLLEKLDGSCSSRLPVSCIIQDGIMSFAIVAAKEIGVPSVCFRTSPATILLLNKHYRQLEEKGLLPSKGMYMYRSRFFSIVFDCVAPSINLRLILRFRTYHLCSSLLKQNCYKLSAYCLYTIPCLISCMKKLFTSLPSFE